MSPESNGLLRAVFGAHGQIVVGIILVITTAFQAVWWGVVTHPSAAAIFWLSVEALFYGAYGVFGTALGYKATERVEAAVVENIENATTVNIE